jgi:uncharacterized membrane protein
VSELIWLWVGFLAGVFVMALMSMAKYSDEQQPTKENKDAT